MASFSDDFNRATLGSNWTAINGGTWSIASSVRAQQTQSTGVYRALRYITPMATADVDVTIVARSNQSTGGVGVLIRAPETGTATANISGYAVVAFPTDGVYIVRIAGGDDSGIGYGNVYNVFAANTDYTLRVTAIGSTITLYVDGVQRIQVTDTLYTGASGSRAVALLSYGQTPQWDSISAQDVSTSIIGTSSFTQDANTTVSDGSVSIVAASSFAQDNNTLSSDGTVSSGSTSGSVTYTQADDTVLSSGSVASSSSLSQTQGPDIVSSSASNQITGASSFAQDDNFIGYSGGIRFYGNAANRIDRIIIPLQDGSTVKYAVNVGASSFTYELWVKFAYADITTTANDVRYSNIVIDRDSWAEQRGHVIGITRRLSAAVVCFGQAGSGGTWTTIFSTTDLGDSEWHHVAVTRNISNGQVQIWIDGVQEGSGTYDTTDWSFPAGHTVSSGQDNQYLVLGTEKHDVGFGYNGQIDEFRVSNSVRYTGSFTPERVFVNDSPTVGLYRFDESTGNTVYNSASYDSSATSGTMLVGGTPSGPVRVEIPMADHVTPDSGTGNVSYSQSDDTIASAGVSSIQGQSTVTVSGDTLASTGVTSVLGNLSVTQSGDTIASSGSLTVSGSLVSTVSGDSISSSSVVLISGIFSTAQDDNIVSSSGVVFYPTITGDASYSQDGDSYTISSVAAVLSITTYVQDDNTVQSSGVVTTPEAGGSVSYTQDDMTLLSSLVVAITGVAAYQQNDMTLSSAGYNGMSAIVQYTQSSDTVLSDGTVAFPGSGGSVIYSQSDNTVVSTGTLSIVGNVIVTQEDTVASSGSVSVSGASLYTEDSIVFESGGSVAIVGNVLVQQDSDTIGASGNVLGIIYGQVEFTQADNTLISVAIIGIVISPLERTYPVASRDSVVVAEKTTSSYPVRDESRILSVP